MRHTKSFIYHRQYVKVKVKVKVKFTLEQATKTQTGVEVWLYSFFNFGGRWGGW
jgi:hypothetical protein